MTGLTSVANEDRDGNVTDVRMKTGAALLDFARKYINSSTPFRFFRIDCNLTKKHESQNKSDRDP